MLKRFRTNFLTYFRTYFRKYFRKTGTTSVQRRLLMKIIFLAVLTQETTPYFSNIFFRHIFWQNFEHIFGLIFVHNFEQTTLKPLYREDENYKSLSNAATQHASMIYCFLSFPKYFFLFQSGLTPSSLYCVKDIFFIKEINNYVCPTLTLKLFFLVIHCLKLLETFSIKLLP